ncbi:MAG: hypothetical protein ACRCSW_25645, partial [Tabrizicola sp.]
SGKPGTLQSRGGFTSKVHARCDNQGLPIGFILTGGEASDYAAVDDLGTSKNRLISAGRLVGLWRVSDSAFGVAVSG